MKKPVTFLAVVCLMAVMFILLAASCFLSSCNMQKYQVNRMKLYAVKYPTDFAVLSNQIVPCFTGVAKSDTVITEGKPDTVIKKGDSVIVHRHDTTLITIHDTIKINRASVKTIHDTVTDNRKMTAIQSQLNDCGTATTKATTQLSDAQVTSKHRLWWIIGLGTLIVVYTGIKVYTFFAGGGIASIAKKVI